MSDLTREQIEARIAVLDRLIAHAPQHSAGWQMDAIAYRMALRALDAAPTLTCVCAEIDERDRPCLVCECNAPDLPEPCLTCMGSGIVAGPGEYTAERCTECENGTGRAGGGGHG